MNAAVASRAAFIFILLTGLGMAPAGQCQTSELGLPILRTWKRLDYKANVQFFSPYQADNGLMYFGNQMAVLEYDGRDWRILKLPVSFARTISPGPAGQIIIGDEDIIGYLDAPSLGDIEPIFHDLRGELPEPLRRFGRVRDIKCRGDVVWFSTDRALLRWDGQTITGTPFSIGRGGKLAEDGPNLIWHRPEDGLYRIFPDGSFRIVSKSPNWKGDQGAVLLPLPAGRMLALFSDGRAHYVNLQSGESAPWPHEGESILSSSNVMAAITLQDGGIAVGTEQAGLIVFSAQGHLERQITPASGLPHPTVFAIVEDRDGALWLSTANGPARFDRRAPATVFLPGASGIGEGPVNDIVRHNGQFYYLSNDGLFVLQPSTGTAEPATFSRVEAMPIRAKLQSLLSHPSGLLILSSEGLERLTEQGMELLEKTGEGATNFSQSTSDDSRLFLTTASGVTVGRIDARGAWHNEGAIAGLDAECYDAIEDTDGTLWVTTLNKGVFRVTRAPGSDSWLSASAVNLTSADGLPKEHGVIFLWHTSFGMLFDTANGIYRYQPEQGRFAAATELTAFTDRKIILNPITAGAPGEIWTNGLGTDYRTKDVPYPLLRLRRAPDGSFTAVPASNALHDQMGGSGARRMYWERSPDGDGVLWARAELGLLRIDLSDYPEPPPPPRPLIRGMNANGTSHAIDLNEGGRLVFNYSTEPLTIRYASGQFGNPELDRFQTRLLGFNDAWSAPSNQRERTFTNLEGGPFRFEVRNVDLQGTPGDATAITFEVRPPWHRHPITRGVYLIIALGSVVAFVRYRLSTGERERARLEQLVHARTTELAIAKNAAESANRAKSAFLANMSHELRTPLNGVLGYAQIMLRDRHLPATNREQARIIASSGEHLLKMINEVLDFSKIEAGKTELRPAPFRLPDLLRDIEAAISPPAAAKALTFGITHDAGLPVQCIGDAQKLRQVIDNLLSNAIKFTPSGAVTLKVTRTDGNGQARTGFAVIDSGVGLSPSDQVGLFTPFHQAADGRPPEPGTGLGLSICRRLVQLMGGDIVVTSAVGSGSRFAFDIPLEEITLIETPAATGDNTVIVGYAGPRRRVLVVDDVEVNRTLLRDLLRPIGFDVHCIEDGESALAWLSTHSVDAIVLDLRMPGIDGLELTRRIRRREGPQPRIILTSASVLSFDARIAFDAGCDDFLPKPFAQNDLLQRMGRCLRIAWNYAGNTPTTHAPIDPSVPSPHLSELRTAATRGDIRRVRFALSGIRQTNALPNETLAELDGYAAAYQMDRLRTRLSELLPSDAET